MDFTTAVGALPVATPISSRQRLHWELLAKRTEQLLRFDPDPRSKSEARRLEIRWPGSQLKNVPSRGVCPSKGTRGLLKSGKEDQVA